jgi:hypothetical protein
VPNTQTLTAGADVERVITRKLAARFRVDWIEQRSEDEAFANGANATGSLYLVWYPLGGRRAAAGASVM